MYFGHHPGRYFRLAYSNHIAGPWKIHTDGVLPFEACPTSYGHLASPDIHLDHTSRQIRMYYHSSCREAKGQHSLLAISDDGLDFSGQGEILGLFYFRVWEMADAWYALAKGQLYRSETGTSNFVEGPNCRVADASNPEGCIRHTAVLKYNGRILVFLTRIGDAPERILCAEMDTSSQDWKQWKLGKPVEVLHPEVPYEGAELPITPGKEGAQYEPQNALRDPCVFEEDRRVYLVYVVAGEQGIALAELNMRDLESLLDLV